MEFFTELTYWHWLILVLLLLGGEAMGASGFLLGAAAIKVAEGQKQSEILKAEGQLEAAKREAEARERLAQAEAKATEMVSKSIQDGDGRAINYFVAQKYVEALGRLAESDNNKVMMIPLEASSVIGSIAGISDLVKDLNKDQQPS